RVRTWSATGAADDRAAELIGRGATIALPVGVREALERRVGTVAAARPGERVVATGRRRHLLARARGPARRGRRQAADLAVGTGAAALALLVRPAALIGLARTPPGRQRLAGEVRRTRPAARAAVQAAADGKLRRRHAHLRRLELRLRPDAELVGDDLVRRELGGAALRRIADVVV